MPDQDIPAQTGTALVALEPVARRETNYARVRPDVRMLAQLLAARHDAPVYRQRRRGAPVEASAAYRQAAGICLATIVRRDFSA